MREIQVSDVTAAVRQAAIDANYYLGQDMIQALEKSLQEEESPAGREVLRLLLENARIAREQLIPICQDCGLTVVFVELGQEVHLVGGGFHRRYPGRGPAGLSGRLSAQVPLPPPDPPEYRR